VILLGDAPYYARYGITARKTAGLSLPGPFGRDRLLGLELTEGALDGAWGVIVPTGRPSGEDQGAAREEGAAACSRGLTARPCRSASPHHAMPRVRACAAPSPPSC
jgi:hypothetical protein